MRLIGGFFIVLLCTAFASGSIVEDNSKGIEAMNAGRFDEAIQYFSESCLYEPDNLAVKHNLQVAYNNSAMDLFKKGDFDAAYDRIKKAYGLDPNLLQVKKNFAYILTRESVRRYNEKSGKEIIQLLKESLDYDDSLVDTHILLGQAYYEHDEYAEAKQQWDKAIALDPSNAIVRQKLDKLNKEMQGSDKLRDTARYHFKVRYEGAELWTASREVLDILEDAFNNAGWKFGIFPGEPVTVIIYTQEEFQTVSGKSDWFAGVYDGKIRLRKSDVEGDKKRLRQIIYHEYMHAFVHYVAGNKVPAWLNEGIAQCYENMPDKAALNQAEKRLLNERLTGGVPEMAKVDEMFVSTNSQADVNFAYVYSKSFVAYLIED